MRANVKLFRTNYVKDVSYLAFENCKQRLYLKKHVEVNRPVGGLWAGQKSLAGQSQTVIKIKASLVIFTETIH